MAKVLLVSKGVELEFKSVAVAVAEAEAALAFQNGPGGRKLESISKPEGVRPMTIFFEDRAFDVPKKGPSVQAFS
jgi:hypothetical protein